MALSRDALRPDRMRRGDDRAFERLHARHHASVLAFCRHLTGSREDAEDAVQHTFLAAYRQLAGGGEAPDWRPWLFIVARNRCLTLLRARRGESPLVDPDGAATFDGLAVEVERREELRDLVRDMARLPERQRAALVLSQLDALSYREIGTVLEVTPEKVKALVFQARSALAAAREARDAPCPEIRQQIATARGAALRRRVLRRHVGQCEGCREFEAIVRRQRAELGLLLPVVPAAGVAQSILAGGAGREGAATASAGGAVAAASGGAGVVGGLTALGAAGTLKIAVVAAVVGSSAAGALAADLPERVERAAPWHDGGELAGAGDRGGSGGGPAGEGRPFGGALEAPGARRESERGDADSEVVAVDGKRHRTDDARAGGGRGGGEEARDDGSRDGRATDEAPVGDEPSPGRGGRDDDLPPGLAKRDKLPPGLAKRDKLPPGLAKRDGSARGKSGHGKPADRPGGGTGKGGAGSGGLGRGGGQANGGGQGGSGGGAQGNAGGQGNGNAGGQGNGNAGGQGQANGNGQGNGGQGNGGSQGNAGGGGQGNGGSQGNAGGGGQGNAGGQANGGGQGNDGGQGQGGGQGSGGGQGGAGQGGGSSGGNGGGNAGGSPGQPG
jgi:RNA polymerase sigma factor (sigma-70 family)